MNREQLLEKWGEPTKLHTHGFVRLVDVMGGDDAIVQAARVSYGAGTKQVHEDRGLIRYLKSHRHTTPYEMCEIKLHVKLPIFVARQWIRHRTASVNEMSGRYSTLPSEFYLPELSRIQRQSTLNKQGSGDQFDAGEAGHIIACIEQESRDDFSHYDWMNDHDVARELARINLGLNTYTEWYWKIDLHNLLHFLGLRMDSHAQQEFQDYANVIGEMVQDWCPHAWEAFIDYQFEACTFSRQEMNLIRDLLEDELQMWDQNPDVRKRVFSDYDLGPVRERREFCNKLRQK